MNDETAKSIARSVTALIGQQIITWTSTFFLMLFLPRYLGPVDYGRLYLAHSIAGLFLMPVDFDGLYGIGKRIARARENTSSILVNSLGFRVAFWFVSFLGMMTFSFIVGYPLALRVIILIFGFEMLWMGAKTVLTGCFLGHEVMPYSSPGAITERVFISIVGVCALLLGAKASWMALIMVTGTFLNFLWCVKFTGRIVTRLPRFDWRAAVELIKTGSPYLLWAIFGVIYYRVDIVMLSFLTPEAVVGWYGAAYKLFDVLAFLPSIYSLTILPVLSRLWGKENSTLLRTTQKSLEFILIAGIPISIGVFFFARQIIQFFFGLKGYGPSVINLEIFSVGLILLYIDMVLGSTLIACDKQRQWATVAFFAVIVNVSLNYFAIPYTQIHMGNGGIGAAIATITTEFFVMTSAVFIMPKGIPDGSAVPVSLKSIGAGIVMAASMWLLRRVEIALIVQAIIGPAVYFALLFMLKAIGPAEISLFRDAFSVHSLREAFVPQKGRSA